MNIQSSFLDSMRLHGDVQADQLINQLFNTDNQYEVYSVLELDNSEIRKLKSNSQVAGFLTTTRENPDWFDPKSLLRGQKVFEFWATEIMFLLGSMALPYCYAASPGNKALYLSDKMRYSPGKRLLDTATFVIEVSTPGSLNKSSNGIIQINKTRLIHAIARYYLMKKSWNMEWGLPINMEDMAGTNLAFSVITLLGLQKSGVVLSDKQKNDFIHLWRYIGYQMHIHNDLLPTTYIESYHLAKIIKKRNFRKSKEGIELTSDLLKYYKSIAPATNSNWIETQVRYLVGSEVASYLGLESEPLRDSILETVNNFRSLQNLLTTHSKSYNEMILNHKRLKTLIKTD
jgi:hypothetical protein